MTAIAYLVRETAARGIRVRVEDVEVPAPPEAHFVRTIVRRGHGAKPGEDGKPIAGDRRNVEIEVLVPHLGADLANTGRPVMWWTLERKVGDHTEEVWKGSKKNGKFETVTVEDWAPDWQVAAGDLADSMGAMAWVYEWAALGEAFAPRSEWLACSVCDEAQLISKAKGSNTARRKCHMTFRCEGFVRRLPNILQFNAKLKPLTAPKPKVEKPPAITPGAERLKEKLAKKVTATTSTVTVEEWVAGEAEYVDEGADIEAA